MSNAVNFDVGHPMEAQRSPPKYKIDQPIIYDLNQQHVVMRPSQPSLVPVALDSSEFTTKRGARNQ